MAALPRRGASARHRRRGRRSWRIRVPAKALLGALALAAIGGLGYGGAQVIQTIAAVPVARVVFSGELQYVARQELIEQVQPQLAGQGFFTVDLDALRDTVEQLPWVDSVAVIRHWPNELELVVSEQQPIARWGSDALLNHQGEVFRPRRLEPLEQLPRLGGPDAAAGEVVERYGALATLLAAQNLELAALEVDERGSWTAELGGGVKLNLGERQLLRRAQRFIQVYRAELEARFEQVSHVDLRYANGLAVGWKAAVEQRS